LHDEALQASAQRELIEKNKDVDHDYQNRDDWKCS
jgi:hypothetical protein